MKQWKMPLIALIAFVVMLGWVLLGPSPEEAEEPADEEQDEQIKLIDLGDRDEIAEVTIRWEGREDVVIAGSGTGDEREYKMLSPYPRPTDQDRARLLFTNAAELRVKRLITEEPEDIGEFGLDEPTGEIIISGTDGSTHRIIVGGPSPLGGGDHPDRYVQREDDEAVYLMGGTHLDFIAAPGDRWSDLTMLRLDEVDQIKVDTGEDNWSMSRTDDLFEWQQSAPLDAPANASVANNMISRFNRLRAVQYVHDEPGDEDLADCGLDEPQAQIDFRQKDGTVKEVLLGSFADEQEMTVYAKVRGQPYVYSLEADILTVQGLSSADEWIQRPFGPIRLRNVTELHWSWDDEELSLVLEEEQWVLYDEHGEKLHQLHEDDAETAVMNVLELETEKIQMPGEKEDEVSLPSGDQFLQVETEDGSITLDLAGNTEEFYGQVRGYDALHLLPGAGSVMHQLAGLR